MLEPITDLPANAVGFVARGTVTVEDYENVIIPKVEATLEHWDKVRFLYVLGDDFEGFEGGAAWDDLKLGVRHWSEWEKIAVVTDRDWVRYTLRAFGVFVPGRIRVFGNDELEQARAWIAE